MSRDGQPATPPPRAGQRAPRPTGGGSLEEPVARPRPRPAQPGPAPTPRRAAAPEPALAAPAPAPAEPSTADATGRRYHHRDHFRVSTAWRALKNSWALTRWIVLVVVVGLGVAAVIAVILAALYTLVDSSV